MADAPGRPRDDGKIRFPKTDAGMNKVAPAPANDEKATRLGITDKPDSKAKDEVILARARKRMDRCIETEALNRKSGLLARKFYAGEQWDSDVAAQRNIDNRPCLTFNRLPAIVHQVTNDQRANRPTISVSPIGDKGDPEAAKMYRGMIRHIERESAADIAHDTAFESAVIGGIGYSRIMIEWERDDSFNQTIVVKRVRNPFTVYLDPDHQEPDGSDCKFGFITEIIPTSEFEEEWPDALQTPFDLGGAGEKYRNWTTKDGIRIAEYYEREEEGREWVELDNGHEGWEDELTVSDPKIERQRTVKVPKWMHYKLTAVEILEREEWIGAWLPIVPVLGNEIDIEGRVKVSGLVEGAMDGQRMYNYDRTSYAEMVSLAPKAPFIAEEGQIEGHEDEWRLANTTANPVLMYKGTSVNGHPAPPPQRQPLVGIPEGFAHSAETSAMDIMATTGIRFDVAADHRGVDERSGKALREFNRPQDLGSSHYLDNFVRYLKHIGRQYLDLIPKVYDEKQVVTILREDETEEQVQIDPHAPKASAEVTKNGKKMKVFNPKTGKYGVTVTIGPSYATKRVEASENMIELIKAIPEIGKIAPDLIVKNMDFEDSEELTTRLAKAVPPQLLTPDQKDVPPQLQAYIQHLEGTVKQGAAEKMQMLAAINDKQQDRAIATHKIDSDFEAKILKVVADAEAKAKGHMLEAVRLVVTELRAEKEFEAQPEGDASGRKTGKPGKEKTNAGSANR